METGVLDCQIAFESSLLGGPRRQRGGRGDFLRIRSERAGRCSTGKDQMASLDKVNAKLVKDLRKMGHRIFFTPTVIASSGWGPSAYSS